MADITSLELRELSDLIEAYSDLKTKAQSAGLMTQDGFLEKFKTLEQKIQTQLTNTIQSKTK